MAKDDRSDDDEVEFMVEQQENELRGLGVDAVAAPKIMLNNEPVSPSSPMGASTGMDFKRDGVTNRIS